jgi:hypothetical protein
MTVVDYCIKMHLVFAKNKLGKKLVLLNLFTGIVFREAIPSRTAIALDSLPNGSQETCCFG